MSYGRAQGGGAGKAGRPVREGHRPTAQTVGVRYTQAERGGERGGRPHTGTAGG